MSWLHRTTNYPKKPTRPMFVPPDKLLNNCYKFYVLSSIKTGCFAS